MGCFNSYGYLSNLPIVEGDEVFVFICVQDKKDPCYLTPICFPIFGRYDDYGCVDRIKKDESSKWLSEKIGMMADKILEVITNNSRRVPDNGEKELYLEIKKALLGNLRLNAEYDLYITIDHEEVYRTISGLCIKDTIKSYELSIKNEYLLSDFYDMNKLTDFKAQEDSKFKYIQSCTLCINPSIKTGYWGNWAPEFSGYMLLESLKDYGKRNQEYWKSPRWKDIYITFMSFWKFCWSTQWPVTLFRWGGQKTNYDWFRKINKSFGEIIEKCSKRTD